MSFRSKILVLVLGAALAVIAGRTLTATTLQHAISGMASAVWGS
jgi:hypothetical protein